MLDAGLDLERRRHRLVAGEPRRREGQHLPGRDVELVDVPPVARVGEPLSAQDEHVGPGDGADDGVGATLPVIGPAAHPGARRAVAEADDPLVDHPNGAVEPLDATQHVGAPVGDRHEVGHPHGPRGGAMHRLEDEGAVDVAARGDGVLVDRTEQPAAVVGRAEQCGEAGVRVEAWQAQPVDRPAPADEGGRAEVAQDGILLDRRGHVLVAHAPEYAARCVPGGPCTPAVGGAEPAVSGGELVGTFGRFGGPEGPAGPPGVEDDNSVGGPT